MKIIRTKLKFFGPVYSYSACLIHDSWILLFNVFFNLILKLWLYCREIIPFSFLFCFRSRFLPCYLFVVISWKITFVQGTSRTGQKNIWKFKMATLNSLKFNRNKLKTLWQKLRQYRVKNVRKNIFIKTFCGRTENYNLHTMRLYNPYT